MEIPEQKKTMVSKRVFNTRGMGLPVNLQYVFGSFFHGVTPGGLCAAAPFPVDLPGSRRAGAGTEGRAGPCGREAYGDWEIRMDMENFWWLESQQ